MDANTLNGADTDTLTPFDTSADVPSAPVSASDAPHLSRRQLDGVKALCEDLGAESGQAVTICVMVSDEDVNRGYLDGFLSDRNIPEGADVIVLRNRRVSDGQEYLEKQDDFLDGNQRTSYYLWEWTGEAFDFGRGRNIMQHLAGSPWLLHMDADERVYEHERLIALCNALPPDCGAAYCTLVWHQTHGRGSGMAKHRGTYPILRLVRNDPRIYWSWQIHEQVLPSVIHAGLRTCDTRLCIVHEGYAVDKETMVSKHKRNIQGLMRQWVETPNDWLLQKLRHTVIEWHMTEAEDPDVLKQTIDTDEILPDGLEMRQG